jgi:DNA-binding response OmpR family regulator
MPATRLLVIADSKMLPALANGLRDGARFDVLTVPLSDPARAQAAAEKADAVALFYGAPGAPLTAALQTISPKLRDRGCRLVAVLQMEQAAQRDECFRAGASDLLFMPMPKDQFVARLQSALDLSWETEAGALAPVSVSTRTSASKLDRATISISGVEALAELPLKAGETVRLSWGTFQSWGLVVKGGPPAQIRFAGLAPDEEAQIRDWLKSGTEAASAPATPVAQANPAAQTPTPRGGSAPASPAAAARAAPSAGPPPGFADRKPIRPQTRGPARVAPPLMSATGAASAAESAGPAPAFSPTPASGVPVAGSAAPPASASGAIAPAPALSNLFDDGAGVAPAASGTPEAGAALPSPPWPVPVPLAASKAAAMQMLKDKTPPADAPAGLVASARKITGMLGSAERAALEKGGPDSLFAEALAARIALDTATSEGVKLFSGSLAASVDPAAFAALARISDDAAARLQKEANAAVGKGEVESLQMITAASAALSRDHLHFRETADRLRGLSAAPRLGAGALDPDMILPGQAPRPASSKPAAAPQVRAELRGFQNLDRPANTKKVFMVIAVAAFVAALANAVYFSVPHQKELTPEIAGKGVERIDVFGPSALVTVSRDWLVNADAGLPPLVAALREAHVKKATLIQPNGAPAGILDVATGKVSGLAKPKATPPPK